MDAFSAGFDITTARFIFSQDWLLLAGSFGKHGCLQIRANEFVNGVDGNTRFEVKSNYLVDGMITCVESCTIERLGKNVIVVGGVRANDCSGFLEIVNLRIQGGKVDLTPNDSFDFLPTVLHGIANITGIVFRPDREILILSTEGGEIIILDLYLGKILYREMIDATGIVKIQMSVTGQLVTLGRSSSAPIKVWDLRFSEAVEVLTLALQLEIPLHSPLKATASFREPLTSVLSSSRKAKSNNNMNANIEDLSRRTDVQRTALQAAITCFTVHPTQDRIFLGNTTGAVILWDLRMNSTVAFQAHSSRGKKFIYILRLFFLYVEYW